MHDQNHGGSPPSPDPPHACCCQRQAAARQPAVSRCAQGCRPPCTGIGPIPRTAVLCSSPQARLVHSLTLLGSRLPGSGTLNTQPRNPGSRAPHTPRSPPRAPRAGATGARGRARPSRGPCAAGSATAAGTPASRRGACATKPCALGASTRPASGPWRLRQALTAPTAPPGLCSVGLVLACVLRGGCLCLRSCWCSCQGAPQRLRAPQPRSMSACGARGCRAVMQMHDSLTRTPGCSCERSCLFAAALLKRCWNPACTWAAGRLLKALAHG